ncbi:MAG: xanthine dehydrogenase family protein molybdopterin-binding subunit [Chloroflexota bacterium]|nr:xanthine dehydrogenase family protein molybdopterin-binding subunit [Chloroflexota bacterium]
MAEETPPAASSIIGARLKRPEGGERVTGRTRFAADLSLPGLLHARLVLSPHTHARIARIDASAALAQPGVVSVATAETLAPYVKAAAHSRARALLARDEARFCGQPVAVVLAESEAAAEDALALVDVEYAELPAVLDAEAAFAPDAPAVWPEGLPGQNAEAAGHGMESGSRAADESRSPNVAATERMDRGDVAAGFRDADVVVERTYHTQSVHQGYLEPHATLAATDPTGDLTIWSSTQGVFFPRDEVATVLGWPEARIKVVATPVGGGFGGKGVLLEPLVAVLAVAYGRPVSLVMTRMDEFLAATPTPRCRLDVKLGAKRDGTLTALEARILFDAGLFPGAPVANACIYVAGFYRVPHIKVRGYEVVTHTIPNGAYRGPGAVQGVFAIESTMDELARELDLDPIELRLKSCVVGGDPMPHGQTWAKLGLRQCLERLREHPAWRDRARRPNEGVGVAIGGLMGTLQPASALCRLGADGTITIVVGSVDISGSNTALLQLAADAFGVPPERVTLVNADSTTAPFAGMSGGSRITLTVGAAVVDAARDARSQAFAIAADRLEASPDDLELVDGRVRVRGAPERSLGLDQIAQVSTTIYSPYPPVLGRGTTALTTRASGMVAHLARVRIDPDTHAPRVVEYVAVQDAGRAINPAEVEGNIHGGVAQGIGWALYETMAFDPEGRILTASFLDYALPTSHHVPPVEAVIVEEASESGPHGLRVVGEPPVIPGAATIANAIRDATGLRMAELPITPERLHRAIVAAASRPSETTQAPAHH